MASKAEVPLEQDTSAVQTASVFKEPLNVTLKKKKTKEIVQSSLKGEAGDAASLISVLRIDDVPIATASGNIPEKTHRVRHDSEMKVKKEEDKKAHVSQRLRRGFDAEHDISSGSSTQLNSSSKDALSLRSSSNPHKKTMPENEKLSRSMEVNQQAISSTPFSAQAVDTSSSTHFSTSREATDLLLGAIAAPAANLTHSLSSVPSLLNKPLGSSGRVDVLGGKDGGGEHPLAKLSGSSSTNERRRNSRHNGEKGSTRTIGGGGRGTHSSQAAP